ncbi:MAG: ABC transporter permease [Anaerolineales bacterium]|jgi:ABC-2 type transport system permease protein
MNLRRIGVLLGKELVHGSKNFIFIFAVVIPIVISLVISLLFGTLFLGKPKLGLADQGSSQLSRSAKTMDSIILKEYPSDDELQEAVARGAVDLGVVLPQGFDDVLQQGQKLELLAYVWGESLLKNRAILGATLVALIRETAGQETPVEIISRTVGGTESVPWEQRLLPLMVLMAVIIGGSLVPATSLVDEKGKRTLGALVTTPTSLEEVYLAKGLMGALLSLVMGILILIINRAFGEQPALLLLILSLAAVMAGTFGVLLGALMKDINSLFATVKAFGILLYAPALVYLFPSIPQWIGKIFPTYYIINPIVEITQRGASWTDVAVEIYTLLGLVLILIFGVGVIARRTR